MSTAPEPPRNLYAAPVADDERRALGGDALDELVARTRPTRVVITAAAIAAVTGTILALSAVQLWINFKLLGFYQAIPVVMVALALVHFGIAAKTFRLRLWAARTGFGLGSFTGLVAIAWIVLAAASGLVTLYGLVLPFLAAATAVLSFLAIAPCRAGTEARRLLDRDGLQTDF